ncbi:RNA polymerase sigma factor [Rubripirellula sp.]|nr:RNA polymerase sigma factor [Rubripirellula sp.]MDF1843709.1 sigma-70 family RNA polymerase sigma factor [Rubripirellula sp.]
MPTARTLVQSAMMVRMETNKDALLEVALQGDKIALQQLLISRYEQLAILIRARIPAQLCSVLDVDDILQITFIHVFRGISNFKAGDADAFHAWVRSIAEAKVTDAIRSATRKKRGGGWKRIDAGVASSSESLLDFILLLSDERRSPSQSAATHEAVVALKIALAGLPEDQREAITLRYIDCLTIEEVIDQLNKSEPAVRGLLHRGKLSLKQSLGQSSTWFSKTQ